MRCDAMRCDAMRCDAMRCLLHCFAMPFCLLHTCLSSVCSSMPHPVNTPVVSRRRPLTLPSRECRQAHIRALHFFWPDGRMVFVQIGNPGLRQQVQRQGRRTVLSSARGMASGSISSNCSSSKNSSHNTLLAVGTLQISERPHFYLF